ncbi:MAG TPA: alpha/beta hydrolase, partial [Allosphingosinicella sp.]
MAAAFALLLLGAHLYALPHLSPWGSLLLNWLSPWFVVLPLFAAALIWFAGPRERRGLRKALSLVAVAVAGIGAVAVGRMVAAAHEYGVPIALVRTLGSHAPLPDAPDHDIVYSRFNGEPLGLVLYEPDRQKLPAPAPILVYVHGGGWVAGDRFGGGENLRWFARRGWLSISIDYPLSSPERHLWDGAIDAVGCALAWVQANAHRFGGDPTRISLMGDSAGDNLVLNAGYRANTGTLRSSCGGTVPRV